MTTEDDKRISAEYGLTPGEWRPVLARTNHRFCWRVFCDKADKLVAYSCLCEGDARAMAKSKKMIALLERAVSIYNDMDEGSEGIEGEYFYDAIAPMIDFIAELKIGSKHE